MRYEIQGSYVLSDGDRDYDILSGPIVADVAGDTVTVTGLDCKPFALTKQVSAEFRALVADEYSYDDLFDFLAAQIADHYDLVADARQEYEDENDHISSLRSSHRYI